MSLHKFAEQVAAQGRGDDSLLVHMTPDEVQRLQAFAEANGTTMTINPETGLPEAGFLSDLFKAVAPIALGAFLGPAGLGMSSMMAGVATGGITTLATGSLSRGLMAGLGAYGGAGLGESFMGAGTGAGMTEALAGSSTGNLGQAFGDVAATATDGSAGSAFNKFLTSNANPATMSGADLASSGFKAAATDPLAFAKSNLGNLGYAAAPILAGAMVPTTTKAPETKNTNYIRQFDFNINPITGRPDPLYGVRSMAPVKASEFGDKTFQGQRDIFRQQNPNPNPYDIGVASLNQPPQQQMGMAGGGIVALARGGVPRYDGADGSLVDGAGTAPPAISSVEDLYTQVLGRAPDAGGLAYWQQGFGDTIDANEIASFKQAAQAELANRSAPEQQILAPNLVNTGGGAPAVTSVADLYQGILGRAPESSDVANYWQNQFGSTIDANELAQFKTAAQAEIDARNTGTTGGIANLATAGGTSLADAQAQVNNMYRNVLGRDADPTGLAFWSNAIASGRPAESVYQDFLTSARANTELVTADQIKNKTFADATKAYTGYMSADTSNIVDDWVRNTLGREPTAADKQQQWYKDAYTSMSTQGQAKGLYDQFLGYAGTEATKTIADRIKAIDAELRAKGLTDADLLAQTGFTKQQLANEGIDLGRNLIGASQLTPAGRRTEYDLKAALKKLTPITNTSDGSVVARTVTNPYGNTINPGDLTRNVDGSTTVTPNIPYRPYGGFRGIQEIKDAYTQGGGSLGFTSRVPKSIDEFNQMYNKQTGDSEAAYNFLMGKGAAKYPMKTVAPNVAVPYAESVLGKKSLASEAGNKITVGGVEYDLKNPAKAPPADSTGAWQWNTARKRWIKVAADGTVISSGYDGGGGGGATSGTTAGTTSGDVTSGNVANSITGLAAPANDAITVSDMSTMSADAAAAAAATASDSAAASAASDSGTAPGGDGSPGSGARRGGLMPRSYAMGGYAIGGGLGSLGSYSDGGRLLKGPGDGVSDSIPATIGRKQQPARLADGEFVIPARIVSELGNGSTEAGAKKLYAMMDRVQKARGKTTGKNKVAANSRADKYLPA